MISGVVGCASSAPQLSGSSANSGDSAVFTTVVRVVVDSARWPVSVDPRPIANVDSERFALPTRETVEDRVVSARQRALKQLGVAEAEFVIPRNCWSILSPPDQNGDDHKSGCPNDPKLIVSISLPRSNSELAPAGLRDYRAVRVPEMFVSPGGFNIIVYAYIFTRSGKGWSLLKREPTLIME
jgi:hypothetical protein